MKMQSTCAKTLCLVASLLLLAGTLSLQAGNDTWNGGGGDNNWGTAANWAPGSFSSPPASNDFVFFDGATQLTANNNYNAPSNNVSGIQFNSTAGAFILTGNIVTNTGGIV